MADNLSGLNVATRVGEGNANVMSWGNLDRAANQLYQEQKQREARGYNDYLQGQAALQKEFANVRSADIPDVVAAYNDLKKTKQAILFDDKIKNDAVALSKAQQQAQIKEAELRQLIKGSQELKDADKVINARKVSHPDDFDEVLVKEHINDLNLPLKDRIKTGRLDTTPYLYKGVDMAKLGQWAKESAGVARALPIGEEVVADGGYKLEQKHILRSNNPVQYADNMYKRFQTNKGGQAAAALLNQMSDTKKQQIISSFNSIPDAEFKSKWGVDKKDLVNGVLPDDKAGQYVMLDAMQYAVNNMPQEAESKFRPNEAFKNEQNIKEWNRRNNITNQQKTARAEIVGSKKATEGIDFLKKGLETLQAKDSGMANEHFSAWKANTEKDSRGNDIGFSNVKVYKVGDVITDSPNKRPIKSDIVEINYTTKKSMDGFTKAVPHKEYIDLKDPELLPKLASYNKMFLGSDAKVEKGIQTEVMGKGKTVSSPKPSKDPLGLFNK